MRHLLFIFLVIGFGASCTSCGNTKKLTYFQGIDTASLGTAQFIEPKIQKGDLLGIMVYSNNPAASAIYNQPAATPDMAGEASIRAQMPTYLVNETGDIHMQEIGSLHVEGYTRKQLDSILKDKYKESLTNAYFNIRFLNYKITVVGEVLKAGVYNIPSERVNIVEALGLAGDISVFGKRDNVLVVREVDGQRIFGRIDLTKPEAFLSPYYQLQQNDIIYVEATKKKVQANDQTTIRYITISASIISTLAILINVLNN